MKRLVLITLVLLLGVLIGTSSAVEVTLFGPAQYVRTNGKPNLYKDSFPGIAGKGKLIIINGDKGDDHRRGEMHKKDSHRSKDCDNDDNHRVSSALISINGHLILGPKDFSQERYIIEVPVRLKENNSISVDLRSKPGSYLTVQVAQEVQVDAAAVIGPEGGGIEAPSGDGIYIPPGALSQPYLFQLNRVPIESFANVPNGATIVGAVEVLPDGVVLNSPATLYIQSNGPTIPQGTIVPIFTYLPIEGQYSFEQWFGKADNEGVIISYSISHLSIFLGIIDYLPEPVKKQKIIDLFVNKFNSQSGICAFEKGLFSMVDLNKVVEYVNNPDLHFLVMPWLLGGAAAKYMYWGISPVGTHVIILDNLESLNFNDIYHELMHYIFRVKQSEFEKIGWSTKKSHDEDLAYYIDGIVSNFVSLYMADAQLKRPNCDQVVYSKNLSDFVDWVRGYVNGETGRNPEWGQDTEAIPDTVLNLLTNIIGVYANPGEIYQLYQNGECGTCGAPPPPPPPPPVVIRDDFSSDSGLWEYTGSAYWDSSNGYVVLTPTVDWQVGAIWYKGEVSPPFTINFKYLAGGGTGADGLVFMFCKNKTYDYGYGGALGFNPYESGSAEGYGIEFDNFQNNFDPSERHIALIKDSAANHLVYVNDDRTEDNNWHNVTVAVGTSSVTVFLDGSQLFSWSGTIDASYKFLGFSGSTGVYNNWEIIDDVELIPGSSS